MHPPLKINADDDEDDTDDKAQQQQPLKRPSYTINSLRQQHRSTPSDTPEELAGEQKNQAMFSESKSKADGEQKNQALFSESKSKADEYMYGANDMSTTEEKQSEVSAV